MTTVVNRYNSTFDIYIGRGSIWGNPFPITPNNDRAKVIEMYREHLTAELDKGIKTKEDLLSLDGKVLGCFCKPQACHGDVIVEFIEKAKLAPN